MKIAVCIPVYNEEKTIALLIGELINALNLANVEYCIQIYLDGCNDKTIEELNVNFGLNRDVICHLSEKRQGKLFALNYLAKQLEKIKDINYVLQIDSDIIFEEALIVKCIKRAVIEKSLIIPKLMPLSEVKKNIFYRWSLLCCEIYNQLRIEASKLNQLWFVPGGFMFFDVDIYRMIYPINNTEITNEDAFIGWGLISNGLLVDYYPELVIYTKFPLNLSSFLSQKIRVRNGFIQLKKMNVPVEHLRTKLNSCVLKEIFITKQFALIIIFILDNFIYSLSKLSLFNAFNSRIWNRIN